MKLVNISKIVLLSGVLAFGSCVPKMPTENVKIKIDTDKLLPYNFSMQFINESNGQAIIDKEVKIEISGKDADKIYELSGTKSFKVVNGFINLAIKTASTPSEANPLEFVITATADGYLATTVKLNYTEAESRTFDIAMISLANLPASISKTSTTVSNSGDGLSSDLTVTPAKVSTVNTGMSITIPAGTKFLDASGNTLSGNFDVNVYYFSPESDALQYTPQGDENGEITVKYKNNQSATYLSTDAACAYIEITSSNSFVASFSQPATISMDVHKELVNLESGNSIVAGDSLEFISRTIAGPEWNFQKNSIVVDNGGSSFTAVGQFSNTYWVKASFGGKGRILGKKASSNCTVKYKFVQSASTCPSTFRLQSMVWRRSNGASILGWVAPNLTQNQVVSATGLNFIYSIPTSIKNAHNPIIRANPYNLRTNTLGATVSTPSSPSCLINGAYATAPALNYTLPAGQSCNPILLTVNINCPSLSVTSIPPIYKKLAGTPATTSWSPLVFTARGSAFPGQYYVHGLTIGQTYTFKTVYKGKEYTYDQAATGQTMSLTFTLAASDCP